MRVLRRVHLRRPGMKGHFLLKARRSIEKLVHHLSKINGLVRYGTFGDGSSRTYRILGRSSTLAPKATELTTGAPAYQAVTL